MSIKDFLETLRVSPEVIDFNVLMALIDSNYNFTPCAFKNGDLQNHAGENSGSCKLFYFAKLHGLSEEETLACFGDYYREDVLKNPDSDNHQNIRNFIKHGWQGLKFEADALVKEPLIKSNDF
ncbi:MAG TPA: type III effector [Leucothrix sp.]|nr:type III effector [Leucothrix sp.]HIQ15822.1 type III effector [Leucothrix sp.]